MDNAPRSNDLWLHRGKPGGEFNMAPFNNTTFTGRGGKPLGAADKGQPRSFVSLCLCVTKQLPLQRLQRPLAAPCIQLGRVLELLSPHP